MAFAGVLMAFLYKLSTFLHTKCATCRHCAANVPACAEQVQWQTLRALRPSSPTNGPDNQVPRGPAGVRGRDGVVRLVLTRHPPPPPGEGSLEWGKKAPA